MVPFLLLLPVMSVLFSVVLLGESLTMLVLGGGTLVILGVAVTVFAPGSAGKRKAKRRSEDDADADAAIRAYRAQLEAGDGDEQALDAAFMVYRIRHTDIAEDKVRELLAGQVAKPAESR